MKFRDEVAGKALKTNFQPILLNMRGSQYLKQTGILDCYEKLLTQLYSKGWPEEKSIFNHAADEILRYGSKFQSDFKGIIGKDFEKRTRKIYETKEEPENDLKIERSRLVFDHEYALKRGNFILKSKSSATDTQKKVYDLSIFDQPRV